MRRRNTWFAVLALAGGLLVPLGSASANAAAVAAPVRTASAPAAAAPVPTAVHPTRHACDDPRPGRVACTAIVRTDYAKPAVVTADGTTVTPADVAGYGPSDLRSAYNLPTGNVGTGQTVAIVDAYDLSTAESDLNTYRSQYGLPACTTDNGCFRKVDENGGTNYPGPDPQGGWGTETSLDLDMVSAACPNCDILLVEAAAPTMDDLGTGVNTAVALGAKYVSNSFGGPESSADTTYDSEYFNHPGVAVTVAAGDSGYGVEYPAASSYVTAVGGTSLTRSSSDPRGWTETAWSGTGSGCSNLEPVVAWQDVCTRAVADVSAVADPQTGVAVYDSTPDADNQSGWLVVGGTSAAAPLIAGIYAIAGQPGANTYPSSYLYRLQGGLNDVTSGSNGSCSSALLCNAQAGYDGPSGVGTPSGVGAFGITDDPIVQKYISLGGSTSGLGDPTGRVQGTLPAAATQATYQMYQRGMIVYSATYGAHVVRGDVLVKYEALAGPDGPLGVPTSDQLTTADGKAQYNTFSGSGGSAIYYPAGSAYAYEIQGAIYAHWLSLGGEAGVLGYPVSDESVTQDGVAHYNDFSNDGSIYWTPNTGAWSIHGAIRYYWYTSEYPQLGYPTSDETGTADGLARYNTFSGAGGSAIYWTPNTGAHEIQGSIYAHWKSLGGEAGVLGYPVTDETITPDGIGRYNHFSNHGSIYWTPNTGAWSIHGAIRDKWAALGWERSALGYPTSDETGTADGVARYNTFAGTGGSAIYFTGGTGAHEIQGSIYAHWLSLGGEAGVLGYPVTDETITPDGIGRYNHFSNHGSIYWTPNTGAWSIHGAIRDTWAALGWERSRLGYPTSDEFGVTGGRRNNFQHGTITWWSGPNTIQVSYY